MDVCLVSVVCCQVGVSATGRSLVQSGLTDCGASECDRGTSQMRHTPTGYVEAWQNRTHYLAVLLLHVSAPILAGLHNVYSEENMSPCITQYIRKSHTGCPESKPKASGFAERKYFQKCDVTTNLVILFSKLDSHGTLATKHVTAANKGHVRDTRCWNISHVQQCTEKENSTEYKNQLAARIEMTNLFVQNPHEPITKMAKTHKTRPVQRKQPGGIYHKAHK